MNLHTEITSIQLSLDKQKSAALKKVRAAHKEIKIICELQKRIDLIKEKAKG